MKSLAFFLTLLLSVGAGAQATLPYNTGGVYHWPVVSGTGQLGSYLNHALTGVYTSPSTYGIDWTNAGTAPTACTFQVEGSSDGTNWFAISNIGTASPVLSCTTPGIAFLPGRPVVFLRIDILTYTAGDGSTAVRFGYTRGS